MSFQTALVVPFLTLAITAFTLAIKNRGSLQYHKEGNRLGMVLAGILSLMMATFLLIRNPELHPLLEKVVTILSTLMFVSLGSGMCILECRWKQIIRSRA